MLWLAGFFFLTAGYFWSASVLSPYPDTKNVGYWYAVVLNNAGYFVLVVHNVTSS